ncbi:hypothetical protein cypCar_00034368 [Cyprinus carpio]|nr:hypothetical protein cypCar_00034368 [Cyprinus carpio]
MVLSYKQVTGEEPHLIASSLLHSSRSQFQNEFNSNHFDAVRGTDSFNLTVMNTTQSDLGMYYCATSFSNKIKFGIGTRLVIKDNFNIQNTHLLFIIVLTVLLTSNITINIILCCLRRNESTNATESKYKQIQATDDDVSITEYEELNFWSSPVITKCSKSEKKYQL